MKDTFELTNINEYSQFPINRAIYLRNMYTHICISL